MRNYFISDVKFDAKNLLKNNYKLFCIPALIKVIFSIISRYLIINCGSDNPIVTISIIASNIVTLFVSCFIIDRCLNIIRDDYCCCEADSLVMRMLKSVLVYLVLLVILSMSFSILMLPVIYFAVKFLFSFHFMIDGDNDSGFIQSMIDSFKFTKGRFKEVFILMLTFLGWFVLSMVTFGISDIYSLPYLLITLTLYYEELNEDTDYMPSTYNSPSIIEYNNIELEDEKPNSKKSIILCVLSNVCAMPFYGLNFAFYGMAVAGGGSSYKLFDIGNLDMLLTFFIILYIPVAIANLIGFVVGKNTIRSFNKTPFLISTILTSLINLWIVISTSFVI